MTRAVVTRFLTTRAVGGRGVGEVSAAEQRYAQLLEALVARLGLRSSGTAYFWCPVCYGRPSEWPEEFVHYADCPLPAARAALEARPLVPDWVEAVG